MDVKFSGWCHIAKANCSPHKGNSLYFRDYSRLLAYRGGDICEWACRDKRNISIRVHKEVDEQIDGMPAGEFYGLVWDVGGIHARLTMNVGRGLFRTNHWPVRTHADREVPKLSRQTDI